jgi:hypothetical protein
VVTNIAKNGYRELSVVPWMVMAAKNAKGQDVILLIDPSTQRAMELQIGSDDQAETQ